VDLAARRKPARPPKRSGVKLGPMFLDADAGFAFGSVFALAAAPSPTIAAAAMTALTGSHLVVRRNHLDRTLRSRLVLFALPAFALLSLVWSATPRHALAHALAGWLVAVAAALIGSARDREATMKAVALACLAALPFAHGPDVATVGLIAAVASAIGAVRAQRQAEIALFAAAGLADALALALRAPASAWPIAALGLAPLIVLSPQLAAPERQQARLGCLAAAASLYVAASAPDAVRSWVGLVLSAGAAAAVLIAAVAVWGGVVLARRLTPQPTLPTAFWLAVLIYQLPRPPLDSTGLAYLTPGVLLLFASLGAGFRRARPHMGVRHAHAATVVILEEARERWAARRRRGVTSPAAPPEAGMES
jgi:hypothetical protein